jgi:hypothetical protein
MRPVTTVAARDSQQDDHGAAGRAVAEIPVRPPTRVINQIMDDRGRTADEVGETRPLRADESPQYAQGHDDAGDITAPDMQGIWTTRLFLGA